MDKGYMIKELAALIKVNEGSVINWEIRHRKPNPKNIAKLEKILSLDLTKAYINNI
jgi:ribosome-binding protein aMBF1 (putative translation factor)